MTPNEKVEKVLSDFLNIHPRPGSVILTLVADLRVAVKEPTVVVSEHRSPPLPRHPVKTGRLGGH